MKPRDGAGVQHFRDQILAVLRDAQNPMSTRELADRLLSPLVQPVCLPPGLGATVGDQINGRAIVKCDGLDLFGNVVYVVRVPAPCSGVYWHLRALARAGAIIQLGPEATERTVRWAFLGQIGTDDEQYTAQLEAL